MVGSTGKVRVESGGWVWVVKVEEVHMIYVLLLWLKPYDIGIVKPKVIIYKLYA